MGTLPRDTGSVLRMQKKGQGDKETKGDGKRYVALESGATTG